jgi:maltose alpha-D-glucosyltransferase/alpha-amylase
MLGRTEFPAIGDDGYPLSLGPYGFYWLEIDGGHGEEDGLERLIRIEGPIEANLGADAPLFEALRRYVTRQPWFRGQPSRGSSTSLQDLIPVAPGTTETAMFMAFVKVERPSGTDAVYVVPLAISFQEEATQRDNGVVIARIERDGVEGIVYDALDDERFRRLVLRAIVSGETMFGEAGSLQCSTGFAQLDLDPDDATVSIVETNERGESYVVFEDGPVIKMFRHLEPGINPDLELRRFLTERTGFTNVSAVYGSLEYHSADMYTVAVLQESLARSSDAVGMFGGLAAGWLDAVEDVDVDGEPAEGFWSSTATAEEALPADEALRRARDLAAQLGTMTAGLHMALGSLSEDPDLRPESFSIHYQQSLYQSLRAGVRHELRAISRLAGHVGHDLEGPVRDIVASEREILRWLEPVRRASINGFRTRVHGDFRLDEVFLADGEFVIEDFSGDHTRAVSERRLRVSPLRDVAQMLRSIDYAAMSAALTGSQRRRTWAAWWSRAVGGAFVASYLEAMADSSLLPDDPEATDALLNAFALARSLRELHWDLLHRPWQAPVPLAGIRSTLGKLPSLVN